MSTSYQTKNFHKNQRKALCTTFTEFPARAKALENSVLHFAGLCDICR